MDSVQREYPSWRLSLIVCLLVAKAQGDGKLAEKMRFTHFANDWAEIFRRQRYTDKMRVKMQDYLIPKFEIKPSGKWEDLIEKVRAGNAVNFLFFLELLMSLTLEDSTEAFLALSEFCLRNEKDGAAHFHISELGEHDNHAAVYIYLLENQTEDLMQFLNMSRPELCKTLECIRNHHMISGGIGFAGAPCGELMRMIKSVLGFASMYLSMVYSKEDRFAFLNAFKANGIYKVTGQMSPLHESIEKFKVKWPDVYMAGEKLVKELIDEKKCDDPVRVIN